MNGFFVLSLINFLITSTDGNSSEDTNVAASRILLVGGNELTAATETLILLEDEISNPPGPPTPNFPYTMRGAVGQWVGGERAIVCGGEAFNGTILRACHVIDLGALEPQWVRIADMTLPRMGASSVLTDDTVWVLGGVIDSLGTLTNSTETLFIKNNADAVQSEKWVAGEPLPLPLSHFCTAQLRDGETLICGGDQGAGPALDPMTRRHAWLYNGVKWTEQGPLEYPRLGHACAAISIEVRPSENSAGVGVVAVGGKSSNTAQTTPVEVAGAETFNAVRGEWLLMNQPLPLLSTLTLPHEHVFFDGVMVSIDGRTILLGGHGAERAAFEYNSYFGFRLISGPSSSRALSTPRVGHIAIVIPRSPGSLGTSSQFVQESPSFESIPALLVVGTDQLKAPASEIISFKDSPTTRDIEEFPLHLSGPVGGLLASNGGGGTLLVCGGLDLVTRRRSRRCFRLQESTGKWIDVSPLPVGVSGAAVTVVGDELWMFGGRSDHQIEDAVVAYDGKKWRQETAVKMPRSLENHCAVALDDGKEIMIIGGYQWQQEATFQSRRTWIFDTSTGDWRDAGLLNERRIDPACGLFILADGTPTVIVAGGCTGTTSTSNVTLLERYDFQRGEWMLLPQPIVIGDPETGVYGAEAVSVDVGGSGKRLFLLGGKESRGNTYGDVLEYDEKYGFYDTGLNMGARRYDVAVIPL